MIIIDKVSPKGAEFLNILRKRSENKHRELMSKKNIFFSSKSSK